MGSGIPPLKPARASPVVALRSGRRPSPWAILGRAPDPGAFGGFFLALLRRPWLPRRTVAVDQSAEVFILHGAHQASPRAAAPGFLLAGAAYNARRVGGPAPSFLAGKPAGGATNVQCRPTIPAGVGCGSAAGVNSCTDFRPRKHQHFVETTPLSATAFAADFKAE